MPAAAMTLWRRCAARFSSIVDDSINGANGRRVDADACVDVDESSDDEDGDGDSIARFFAAIARCCK